MPFVHFKQMKIIDCAQKGKFSKFRLKIDELEQRLKHDCIFTTPNLYSKDTNQLTGKLIFAGNISLVKYLKLP